MNTLHTLGLNEMIDPDERFLKLANFIAQKCHFFPGYRGHYLYRNIGYIEYILHFTDSPSLKESVLKGFSNSAMSWTNWDVIVENWLLDDEDSFRDPLDRAVRVRSNDGAAVAAVRLIHSDCVPSLAPGEKLHIQVVALTENPEFYTSEQSLLDEHPNLKFSFMGNEVRIADGFLNLSTDEWCLLKATILKVDDQYTSDFNGNKVNLKYCTVDSQFGKIDVVINPLEVAEKYRGAIKEGSIIYSTAIINGDVAIGEYQDGAVWDNNHLIKLFQEALYYSYPDRLAECMDESCKFISAGGSAIAVNRKESLCALADLIRKYISSDSRISTAIAELDEDLRHGEFFLEAGNLVLCINNINHMAQNIIDSVVAIKLENQKIVEIHSIKPRFVKFHIRPVESGDSFDSNESREVLYSEAARDDKDEVSFISSYHNSRNWHVVVQKWLNGELDEDYFPLHKGIDEDGKLFLWKNDVCDIKPTAVGREEIFTYLKKEVLQKKLPSWSIQEDEHGCFLSCMSEEIRLLVNADKKIQQIQYRIR